MIGIAVLVPPASFPALLAFVIWSAVVAILMYLRSGGSVEATSTSAAEPA